MNAIRSLLKSLINIPPIRRWRLSRYRRDFFAPGSKWPRFYGLFASREEAESAASDRSELVGYDHSEVAEVSLDAMAQAWTSDYPVMFWMANALAPNTHVFDLGGHVGTKYRAWRSYLSFPESFVWTVCDLPRIVEAGQQMSKDLSQLRFTTRFQDVELAEILLASGVLQYADFDLADMLGSVSRAPKHLLINKVPAHDRSDVFTLENLHHSVVPYRVFDLVRFVERISAHGYDLVDQWEVHESSVRVPFTDLGEPVHRGFYFLRSGEHEGLSVK